jgi:hypothetical protein
LSSHGIQSIEQTANVTIQVALSENYYAPATPAEPGDVSAVAADVAVDLRVPVGGIRRRAARDYAFVPMPEAAVDERGETISGKYEVGFSWKCAAVEAITEPCGVYSATNVEFGRGVLASDGSHVAAPGG